MLDFPPPVADLDRASPSDDARRPFADPDTRSPSRFLRWLLRQQRPALALSSFLAVLEWLPGSVGPYLVGRIVDDGILGRDLGAVGSLSALMGVLVLVGIAAGIARPHAGRADLAGRHVRPGHDGQPQGDPAGPPAAAADADR